MAGERLPTLILRVTGAQVGQQIGLWLDAGYQVFTPIAYNRPPVGREFWKVDGPVTQFPDADFLRNVSMTGASLADAIRRAVQLLADATNNGVPFYQVRDQFIAGSANSPYPPHREIIVEAVSYDSYFDFHACLFPQGGGVGDYNPEILPGIHPVQVNVATVPATIFGQPDGSITLTAIHGTTGIYTYSWADDPTATGPVRTNIPGGVYFCVVTDQSGASTTVRVVLASDPRLEVEVQRTNRDVTLVPTGGLPPYSYAWDDGPATATRLGLPDGLYWCTVTDARGATRRVSVLIDPRLYWSRNPINLALDAGDAYRLDPTTKPNLSFRCEVWIEKRDRRPGDPLFDQVGTTLEQPADRFGRTVFQVQALLDDYLDEHVPYVPFVGDANPQRADSLYRGFHLSHYEVYGTPPAPAPTTELDQHVVLRGGLNQYEAQAENFSAYLAAVQPFLTWEPPVKSVLVDQPEFLYYLVRDSFAGFRVQVSVTFDDGVGTQFQLDGFDFVELHQVFCQPVGYQALGLDYLRTNGNRVTSWEVYFTSPDGQQRLSETRRYELDHRRYPHRRFFLYATSLGGMATFAALGEAQLELDVTGEEAARVPVPDYDPLLGDTDVLSRQLKPTLKVASGPRPRAQQVAAQDLLRSRRVLLLKNGRWVPGYLKSAKTVLLDESKQVFTQEFDFVLTQEQHYTPSLLGVTTQLTDAIILSQQL